MRSPRLKPDYQDTWHHLYNRIAGIPQDLPFGRAEKEMFLRILLRLSKLYTVRILAFQVMSNHYHLLVQTPKDPPTLDETCCRFAAFHNNARVLDPQSLLCSQWQARLRDVSWFMRHLQHLFTIWYNRSRPTLRRGALWSGRFKNTILEEGKAVWDCWKYIELNPLRAGMLQDPSAYRFCSLGFWHHKQQHPFRETLDHIAFPMLQGLLSIQSPLDLYTKLREAVLEALAEESGMNDGDVKLAKVSRGQPLGFSSKTRLRMRYWVQGVVIGSELFVRDVMGRVRGVQYIQSRRLTPSQDALTEPRLYSYRRLRHVPN